MTPSIRPCVGTCAVLIAAAVSLCAAGGQDLTQKDADSMQRKLSAILERGSLPAAAPTRAVRTSFTEREVNAYLKYDGLAHVPSGVVNPNVVIADGGRLEGRAIVDLDAVRKTNDSALLAIVAMFAGSVEVRAVGTLRTADGKGTFLFERATVAGFPVSKGVLQAIVSHYSRTPETPEGFNLDKPFDLPAAIRAVEMQRGAATVIQ
jgi:hypothetical protein